MSKFTWSYNEGAVVRIFTFELEYLTLTHSLSVISVIARWACPVGDLSWPLHTALPADEAPHGIKLAVTARV